ncbi:ParA family protein [Bdellovibrio sp. HCB337]|uniref:ParA family protein n=1 Tax=Bdellovibrio sp. HCB337 TaxID=3394358 RepID=UPI0039A549E0
MAKSAKNSFPQKVVSVQMLKGGVAKTTSVLNIGLGAAREGARVLFVDMDQQANLTFALGVGIDEAEEKSVWLDIVEKKAKIEDCVLHLTDKIDLIPSNLNNSVLDRVLLNSNRNWAQSVKGPLSQIQKNYDLILIDTAPALSATNTAVTVASDLVILPVNPDRFSYMGLEKHIEELREIKKDFDLNLTEKILFTKFDGREKVSHELLQKCMDTFEDLLMKSYIRTSTEVKNTIGTGKTIYHTKSNAREDYELVTREVLEIL